MLLTLGTMLVILKLAGVIFWDWWIVLIPFYLLMGMFILWVLVAITQAVIDSFKKD